MKGEQMICPICNQKTKYQTPHTLYKRHVQIEHAHVSKAEFLFDYFRKDPEEGLCKLCGKKTDLTRREDEFKKYCSPKCRYNDKKLWKRTSEKRKTTIIKKYGSISKFQNEVLPQILEEKYGDPNYNNSAKTLQTKREHYGENFQKIIQAKVKKTNLERYGVEYPLLKEQIYQKTKKSKRKRINQQLRHLIDSEKYEYVGLQEKSKYINQIVIRCKKCGNISIFNHKPLEYRIKHDMELCYQCLPKDLKTSSMERQIFEFVEENYAGKIISRHKESNHEIDIFLPEKRFGIEFDGLYYHSDEFKPIHYHQQKTNDLLSLGISIIHIWEDEWLEKRDLMKSIILQNLGQSLYKVNGRDCKIVSVDRNTEKGFLEKNHCQGFVPSSECIGLYHQQELVSLMSFGKPRFKNKGYDWELLRFCNKLYTTVHGSFSKLFKHFISNFEANSILSYCDLRLFTGQVYTKNGFQKIKETEPNYYWVYGNQRFNRFRFRKSELIKEGHDSEKTEEEIMRDKGYRKIYNCGNSVYRWEKENGRK